MPLNPPDARELKAIVDWVNLTDDVRELSITIGDVSLHISRDRARPAWAPGAAPTPGTPSSVAPPAPATPAPLPAPASAVEAPATTPALPEPPTPTAPAAPASADSLAPGEVLISAPMVGTFYASPKPGSPSFVSVGDAVTAETVLCIVEVMKLMNNVEAQVEGTVARILVSDNQAVEYGQPLMVIAQNG